MTEQVESAATQNAEVRLSDGGVTTMSLLSLHREWLRMWFHFSPLAPVARVWLQTPLDPAERLEGLFDLGHKTSTALADAGRIAAHTADRMAAGSKIILGLSLEPVVRALRGDFIPR